MPKSKHSRSSTAPRGSQYVDGQLVHIATNQKLFLRLHVCTVYRETLKAYEQFSKQNAMRILEKYMKKRQAHGVANILEDRFTLEREKSSGKEPFRSWLAYREIADIQRGRSKPEYFVLSVDSELSHQKYYEVYKCKTKEDAYKFESFVKQALADPDFRIRDGPVLDVVPVNTDTSRARSMTHLEFQTSLESIPDNERASTMYQATSPTPPMGYGIEATPPPIRPRTPVSPMIETQRYIQASSAPQQKVQYTPPVVIRQTPSPVYHSSKPNIPLDDLTYINFDAKTGRPYMSNEGPVYMYLSRQMSQPNTGRLTPPYQSSMYNGGSSGNYAY